MVFAEAVPIDGGVLLAVLVVFLVLVGIWLLFLVLGCRLAWQAGRGSAPASLGWAAVAVAQSVPLAMAREPGPLAVALGVLVLQGTFFLLGRTAEAEAVDHP